MSGIVAGDVQHKNATKGYFKQYLDEMDTSFGGKGDFDPTFYMKLNKCMSKFDDKIIEKSQNAGWGGIRKYFMNNGTESDYMNQADHWGGCHPDKDDQRCPVAPYKEYVNNKEGKLFGMD